MNSKNITYLRESLFTTEELNETEYIPNWRKKMTSPDYYAAQKDEYSLFDWIPPKESGFNMNILVDTHGISKYRNHPLWIYFYNGYNNEAMVIPVIVSNKPYMPYPVKLKISQKDYTEFINFVKICRTGLKMVANEKMDIYDLLDKYHFSKLSDNYQINEGQFYIGNQIYALNEMPTYYQDVTGLPFGIWIDTGGAYMKSGHSNSYRLKFQYPENNKNFETWPSMLIPSKEIKNTKTSIPSKIIKSLSSFVDINMNLLLDAAKGNMSPDKFKSLVTKVNSDGNIVLPITASRISSADDFGLQIVHDNTTNLYAVYDSKHHTMLTTKWFKEIGKFKQHNDGIYAYAKDENGNQCIIHNSGVIKKVEY